VCDVFSYFELVHWSYLSLGNARPASQAPARAGPGVVLCVGVLALRLDLDQSDDAHTGGKEIDRKGLSPTASRRASALAVRRSWLEPDVLVDYRFHATR